MKRIACLLLCLLLLPITFRTTEAAGDEIIVRVLLSSGGADAVSVRLSGEYAVDGRSVTGGTVTAALSDGKITVSHSEEGTLKTSDGDIRLDVALRDEVGSVYILKEIN